MRLSCSSVGAQLVLFWYAWAWLFFCSSGNTAAGLGTGAASSKHFGGRGTHDIRALYEIPDEKWENKRILQKEDKFVEVENPTDYPSPALSYLTSTISPTELPSAQPSSTKYFVEGQLLPFSILIHGSLSIEDESEIRKELQNYLLDSFLVEEQELQVEVATDSISLQMVQMVESYIPLEVDEGDSESNGDNPNRSRLLSYIRRRNVHQPGRRLQVASSTSTVSTLVEYQASAILRFEELHKEDAVDKLLALQERQIEALENTGDLQGYFLKWFALQQSVDTDVDAYAENSKNKDKNHSKQDPVVLMAVQIAERPFNPLDWKDTWKEIESILNSLSTADTTNFSSDIENDDGVDKSNSRPSSSNILDPSASSSNNGNNEGNSTWKLAVGIGIALILVGLGGIFFVRRKKDFQFSKGKKSVPIIESTNDDDDPEKHLESITTEKKDGNNNVITECNTTSTSYNISFESNKTGKDDVNDLAIHVNDNADGIQATAERRSSKKSSFAFSPISFLQNSFKGKTQQHDDDDDNDNEESGSVAAKLNLSNGASNDDDSIMGYSLTSLNRDRNNNAGQQYESNLFEDLDTISVASSESDTCNPVFAGIHKILDHHNKSKNLVQYRPQTALDENTRWNDHQDRSRSLLGDGAINNEQGEDLMMSNSFETEDAEDASTCKDEESRKEDMSSVVSSVVSAFSYDGIIPNDLKYNGKDEIMMTPNAMMPVPMIKKAHVVDDVSDAPSDERNNDRSAVFSSEFSADHTRYTDAVRNSKLLDNDPAVLGYLVKNTRDVEN